MVTLRKHWSRKYQHERYVNILFIIGTLLIAGYIKSHKYFQSLRYFCAALIAMFNSGVHFGWPSPSLPKIMSDEYVIDISAAEASYITVIGPLGDVIGSIIYPSLIDIIGRKKSILLIAVPQLISMSMIYFSYHSKILLYSARFIGGLSEAACFTILPVYIGEVSETKVRGFLGSLFSLIFIVGLFVVNIVGSYVTIHTAAILFSIPPIIFLILFSQQPESPYYLIMKSNIEQAETALQKLRGKKNVQRELAILTNDVNRQMSEPGRYSDLYLIKSNRIACTVMFGLRIIQQCSGQSAITLYMQIIFEKSTKMLSKDLASIFIFGLQLSVNFVAILIVDKIGRRPLLIASCLGCFGTLLFLGTYFIVQEYAHMDMSNLDYIPVVGIVIFICAFAIGQGNVVNLMTGEMFSSSIKAKATCIMNILFAFFMIFTTKFYQFTSDSIGMFVPFYFFGICQVIGALFCYKYVLETKEKSLEQIQQELKGRSQD